MTLRVSDHALVRFLDRAGGLDVEGVREALATSLARADLAARRLGTRSFDIKADGLIYRVRSGTVVTIVRDGERD